MITFAAFEMDIGRKDLAGIQLPPHWRQRLAIKTGDPL